MHSRESALQILTDAILARHGVSSLCAEIEIHDDIHGVEGQHTLTWARYILREDDKHFPTAYGAVSVKLWAYEGMQPRFAWFDMSWPQEAEMNPAR